MCSLSQYLTNTIVLYMAGYYVECNTMCVLHKGIHESNISSIIFDRDGEEIE